MPCTPFLSKHTFICGFGSEQWHRTQVGLMLTSSTTTFRDLWSHLPTTKEGWESQSEEISAELAPSYYRLRRSEPELRGHAKKPAPHVLYFGTRAGAVCTGCFPLAIEIRQFFLQQQQNPQTPNCTRYNCTTKQGSMSRVCRFLRFGHLKQQTTACTSTGASCTSASTAWMSATLSFPSKNSILKSSSGKEAAGHLLAVNTQVILP